MTDAELLAEIEAAPAAAKPSVNAARLRGAFQGGSAMLSDEAAGGVAALASSAQTPWKRTPGPLTLRRLYPGVPYPEAAQRWFAENRPDVEAAGAAESGRQAAPAAYVAERDKQRTANAEAREAHPGNYILGEVSGGMVPAALSSGAGLVGSVAMGGLQGLGSSNADSAGGLARDLLVGSGVGAAGHGVASLVGSAASRLAGAAKNRLGRALASATDEAAKAKAAALQSAGGSLGKATADQNRIVEGIRFLMQEPNLTAAQRETLASLQGTPEYATAVEGLVGSLGKRLSENAGKIAQAQAGIDAVNAAKPVAEVAAERVSKGAAKEAVKARLLRYGPPALGSAVGAAIGGPVGVGVGALAGAGTRPMIHALRRMVKDPAVQTAIWKPVLGAAEAGASEPGRALTLSLARAGAAAGIPSASKRASDYLGKSKEEREAEAELERLLAQ